MRLSIPLTKKIDLAALGDLVKHDREVTLHVDQSPYAQMLGAGWTQSKLSQLENKRLDSLVWELAEALRLRLGELPLVDHATAKNAKKAKRATGAERLAARMRGT